MIKRARERGLVKIEHVDLRTFGIGKHHKVDDTPCGGGPGMVLKPEPMISAIRSCRKEGSHVVALSPQGTKLDAKKCRKLAENKHLILVCGHYEGIDERVMELEVDEEISIGDYVLTNGALAAMVIVDAVVRFVPEVLGDAKSALEDSFEEGLLDYPHYTRPVEFAGLKVPEVLLQGNHQEIAKWRKNESEKRTKQRRPDLYALREKIDKENK